MTEGKIAEVLRPCPFCAGLIMPEAEHCGNCGTELPFAKARRQDVLKIKLITWLISLVLITGTLWLTGIL